MESRKIMKSLPIGEPEVTASSHQAVIFSILNQDKRGISWLCNNYIQIFCLKDLYKARKVRKGTLDFSLTNTETGVCLNFQQILCWNLNLNLMNLI